MRYNILIALTLITACQKSAPPIKEQITIVNPGFEDGLQGWASETLYTGGFGFRSLEVAKKSEAKGCDFYASQPSHFIGAKQETPWNGKLYQVIVLDSGRYTYSVDAEALGTGMYIMANDKLLPVSNKTWARLSITFDAKDGIAKIGFVCIDAGGADSWAPYAHFDNCTLEKE